MGDISDLIMEGVLCEQCGCLFEDLIQHDECGKILETKPGPGHPRRCEDCREENFAKKMISAYNKKRTAR